MQILGERTNVEGGGLVAPTTHSLTLGQFPLRTGGRRHKPTSRPPQFHTAHEKTRGPWERSKKEEERDKYLPKIGPHRDEERENEENEKVREKRSQLIFQGTEEERTD